MLCSIHRRDDPLMNDIYYSQTLGGGGDPVGDAVHIHAHVGAGHRLHHAADAAAGARRTYRLAAPQHGGHGHQNQGSSETASHVEER